MVAGAGGFTLVEFLVATAVTVLAASLAVTLVVPASSAFQSLPEAMDLQQRGRVAIADLRSDLASAGSGFSVGWGAGTGVTWPALLPCRWTGVPLVPAGGCASSDSITILSMPAAAPQAITDAAAEDPWAPIRVVPASACAIDRPACRLHAGSLMLIADGTAAFDLFAATSVSNDGRLVAHAQSALSGPYAPGALLGEVNVRSYHLGVESGTDVLQLRRAEEGGSSFAVVDQVVALSFEYFGDTAPPTIANQDDPARREASYGPLPPPVGVDSPFDSWPAGENCVFLADGNRQIARLPTLPPGESGLASLPIAAFADGPWCPDAASPNRYDADLLRVRLVRVRLTLQAQAPGVRGATAWFSQPGPSREAARFVPDFKVSFDVAVRSMRR